MMHISPKGVLIPDALALLDEASANAQPHVSETGIPGIQLFWTTVSTPPAPLIYKPGLVIILQGRKEGSLDGRPLIYDAGNYLTLTLPVPFVCGHIATRNEPLIGLYVGATREEMSETLALIENVKTIDPRPGGIAIDPAPISAGMSLTISRLVECLKDPVAIAVIGPSLKRELFFHALNGPRGPVLSAFVKRAGNDGKIDELIAAISQEFRKPHSVQGLAKAVNMSVSNFHRAFRLRTGQSPLQYIKRLRLHAARHMIMYSGIRVGEAAQQVGYQNPSQFSREFREYFGVSASNASPARAKISMKTV